MASEHSDRPEAILALSTLKDGWLVGTSGELVAWVPAEYRGHLGVHPCVLRIDKSSIVIGVGIEMHAGRSWTLCWRD